MFWALLNVLIPFLQFIFTTTLHGGYGSHLTEEETSHINQLKATKLANADAGIFNQGS